MKRFVCTAALIAFVAASAAGASAADEKQVHAQGCVQPGIEAGCLVVQDKATGNLYSLLINGPKPAVGIGIEFTGTPYNGATACMQGTAVQVASWTKDNSLKCAKGKGGSVQ